MGLFDKIMNSIFNETKKVVDSATNPKKAAPAPAPAQTASPVNAPLNAPNSGSIATDPNAERIYDEDGKYEFNDTFNRDNAYFRDILARNFADYTIEENVPISRFDASAHPKCIPVTFLLSKPGYSFAFFVMPINKTNGLPYRGSKQALRAAGIKHVHCINCYKNEEAYVVNRIKAAM